jgi:MFS family permease
LGLGAIIAGSQLPRLRKYVKPTDLISYGLFILAFTSVGVVVAPNIWLASFLMLICGAAWISIANSLTTSAQLTLPGWVRARGMSIYQMGLMGGSAAGAAVWGKLADEFDVVISIVLSSIFGLIVLFFLRQFRIDHHPLEDFTPVCPIERPHPIADVDLHAGPIVISIEYQTLPEKAEEFKKLMAKTRKSRLKQGALSWSLFEDTEHRGRFVEEFVFETWADYLRRFDRFTTEDLKMQEERHSFHILEHPPKITRRVAAAIKD